MTEIDLTADTTCINNVDWDGVSVKLDGTILNQDNDEMDLDEILAALAAVGEKLRRMVAIAKGEDQ